MLYEVRLGSYMALRKPRAKYFCGRDGKSLCVSDHQAELTLSSLSVGKYVRRARYFFLTTKLLGVPIFTIFMGKLGSRVSIFPKYADPGSTFSHDTLYPNWAQTAMSLCQSPRNSLKTDPRSSIFQGSMPPNFRPLPPPPMSFNALCRSAQIYIVPVCELAMQHNWCAFMSKLWPYEYFMTSQLNSRNVYYP